MHENEYARQLATLIESDKYSNGEWSVLLDNSREILEQKLPSHLNTDEVIKKAREYKIRMELEGVLDEVSEQDWVKKAEVLTELKKDGTSENLLNGMEARNVPPYLLGEPRETQDGIVMEIQRKSRSYDATVKWDKLKSIGQTMLGSDRLVTPYSVRDMTGVGHGKARTVVVYLWKKGALSPFDHEKTSEEYESVKFQVNKEKLQDVITDKHDVSMPPNQSKITSSDSLSCLVCGEEFDSEQALQGHLTSTGHRDKHRNEQTQLDKVTFDSKKLFNEKKVIDDLKSDAIGNLGLDAQRIPPYLLGDPVEIKDGVKMNVVKSDKLYTSTVGWDELDEYCRFLLDWNGLVTPYVLREQFKISRAKSVTAVVYLWRKSALLPADTSIAKNHLSIKFQISKDELLDVISLCEEHTG